MTDQLDIQLGADARGFVRRECPHCRRHFKTRPLPGDGEIALRRLVGKVPHQNAADLGFSTTALTCLYCGRRAPLEGFLTSEQREYVERLGDALAAHLRFERLARQPGRPQPAPLPAQADDSDDFAPVALPCCGEAVRVSPAWAGGLHCPACGVRHGHEDPRYTLQLAFVRE